jgi:hypothetical protein
MRTKEELSLDRPLIIVSEEVGSQKMQTPNETGTYFVVSSFLDLLFDISNKNIGNNVIMEINSKFRRAYFV